LQEHCRDKAAFLIFPGIRAQVVFRNSWYMRFEEHDRALAAATPANYLEAFYLKDVPRFGLLK